MTRFAQLRNGDWINLALVERIDPGSSDPYTAASYITPSGTAHLGVMPLTDDDVENWLRPVIPVAGRMVAKVITVWNEDDSLKWRSDLMLIVGWREFGDYRQPLFIQDLAENQFAFLEGDGQFIELTYDGITCESLKEAVQYAIDTHKKRQEFLATRLAKRAARRAAAE